jgi:DNA-directed RNA polymerase subunit M/transcription elongation factor TFIIS
MKQCIKCNDILTVENTKEYRLKNYVYTCNYCTNKQKKKEAAEYRKENKVLTQNRSKKYLASLKENDPYKYTAIQQRSSAFKRAKKFNLAFDLTNEYIQSLYVDVCPVLGIELKYGGGERCDNSPALDRINPKKGYVTGNVQVLSSKANMMKSNATEEEMMAFAKWVLERNGVAREK